MILKCHICADSDISETEITVSEVDPRTDEEKELGYIRINRKCEPEESVVIGKLAECLAMLYNLKK